MVKDWAYKPISECCKIETGNCNTEDRVDNGQFPFFVRSQKVERINTYNYDCEAVLTAGDGVGTGKVFHYINGRFNAHQRVYVMSEFKNVIGKYFYYYFSQYFLDEVLKYTAKSSVDSVRRNMIADMIIPVPCIEEQKAIAQALSDMDDLIVSEEKLVEKYKNIKSACVSAMFPKNGESIPEMRLPGFIGDWEQRELKDICTNMSAGGDVDKSKLVDSGKYPVIANALTNDGIVGYYNEDFRIKAPAVTVTGRGDVGHAKARKIDFTPVVRLLALETEHDVDFLENAINTISIANESTGVPQLTVPQLSQYVISIPPTIEEEKVIGECLLSFDNLITLHQCKLEKYKDIKKGMMTELLTGKIRLI